MKNDYEIDFKITLNVPNETVINDINNSIKSIKAKIIV